MPAAKISTKSLEFCIISQLNTCVGVNFNVKAVTQNLRMKVISEKLFSALKPLKAIQTLALGAMKFYALTSGQGLDHRNDLTLACGSGHIISMVQSLAVGQSITSG